jgi:ABC-type Fe3+/spermidine/putrescine transport system ATPase subunit
MGTGTAIRAEGLRKSYGTLTAVDGIDLEIAAGEIFALLGPNGAGKTTTVEILEGFRHRDGGTVAVLGTDPAHGGRPWRARIGIVLQLASTAPQFTVLEFVRHFAGFYPRPRQPGEVLARVARGATNAEIGRELFISEATVKTHLLRAFGKLGVGDRTAAVTTAIERGILPARLGDLPVADSSNERAVPQRLSRPYP